MLYYAIIDNYYDVYVGDDGKKHRKYYNNIIHTMMSDPISVMNYIKNLPKITRHYYSYIWSFTPIKKK